MIIPKSIILDKGDALQINKDESNTYITITDTGDHARFYLIFKDLDHLNTFIGRLSNLAFGMDSKENHESDNL